MIDLRPLAPVFLSIACFAISVTASGSNSRSTPSISKSFLYCFTSALFGSVNIFFSASSSSPSKDTVIGTRPTNSGIRPNFTRSCGVTSFSISLMSRITFSPISALKPMDFLSSLFSMIFSSPSNAPEQINKILVVSIWISS